MSPQLPPEGISQSAWDEAEAHIRKFSYLLSSTEIVARAIVAATAAERERCALIAEEHRKSPRYTDWPYPTACADIAEAIRQGSQPSNAIPLKGVVR